jgi:hypothetical protein
LGLASLHAQHGSELAAEQQRGQPNALTYHCAV